MERFKEDRGEAEGTSGKTPKKKEEELEIGQKSLEAVYGQTGLDPAPETTEEGVGVGQRNLGKAKNKKKKKKSSSGSESSGSSTSSSSGGSSDDEDSGIFGEDTKLMKIWRRCPGALIAGAVREARQGLLTQSGTLWNVNQGELPPILTQYAGSAAECGLSCNGPGNLDPRSSC